MHLCSYSVSKFRDNLELWFVVLLIMDVYGGKCFNGCLHFWFYCVFEFDLCILIILMVLCVYRFCSSVESDHDQSG